MSSNDSNFMNKNTMIAIVLSAVVLFGWQYYLGKKYPNLGVKTTTTTAAVLGATPTADANGTLTTGPTAKPTETNQAAMVNKEQIAFSNENLQFSLSNWGMSINNLTLKKHLGRDKKETRLGGDSGGLFEVRELEKSQPLVFQVKEVAAGEYIGQAITNNAVIKYQIKSDSGGYSFHHKLEVSDVKPDFKGIAIRLPQMRTKKGTSSFLFPSFDHQEFIVRHATTTERVPVPDEKEDLGDKKFSGASILGIGSQYFAAAVMDKSEVIPEAVLSAKKESQEIYADLVYTLNAGMTKMDLNFISYAGPKDYQQLQNLDKGMTEIINLGFFASIGTILLTVLKWFYGFVGNWGWAIVLLTLLVRLVVMPFNFASYKSMKKMQKIQPLLQSIRERYKDEKDPAKSREAINRETMNLMREHKVNPIGGCLPMLLQMPVFFALYQVLAQSIELYQAPFILWIQDLSLKDPYYILPILMVISMWAQQKITPSTMDPSQQKIMQFMPLVFGLMMIQLPSGLTLYIFISTLFSVIQQQVFMRDNKPTTMTIKEAKA